MAAQEEEEDLKSQYYGNPDWEHYERIGSFELLFPKSHGLERFEQMRQTLREEGWERLQEDRKLDLVRREYFKKPQEEREQPPPFPPITCDPRTGELLPPKCPPTSPKCKVKVKVLKGSSLMVADITGDADPYVKVFSFVVILSIFFFEFFLEGVGGFFSLLLSLPKIYEKNNSTTGLLPRQVCGPNKGDKKYT